MMHLRVLAVVISSLLLTDLARSQDTQAETYRRQWVYGFMSPGITNDPKTTAVWHIGGGYEALFTRNLAVDIGAGAAVAGVEGGEWGFPASIDGSYYFRQSRSAERSVTPYVSAGYTRGGFSRSVHMFNVGFGFNQWTQTRGGFRFEVRPHVSVERGPIRREWFIDFRLSVLGQIR
jgi:hypothetical protein